mgnify:CR=1 FL=1
MTRDSKKRHNFNAPPRVRALQVKQNNIKNKLLILLLFLTIGLFLPLSLSIAKQAQKPTKPKTCPSKDKGICKLWKQCGQKQSAACVSLGMYYSGKGKFKRSRHFKKQFTSSARYFEKACHLGNNSGCVELAGLYFAGMGVSKNYIRSANLLKKSCKARHPLACYRLAVCLERGWGVTPNLTEAIALHKKGCKNKYALSCHRLGDLYQDNRNAIRDPKKAISFYQKGCQLVFGQSCFRLGVLSKYTKGKQRNLKNARKYFTKACQTKLGHACNELGAMHERGEGGIKNPKLSLVHYTNACTYGNPLGCFNAGLFYKLGKGIKRNYTKASTLFAKGCKRGFAVACNELGLMNQYGLGMPKAPKQALALYTNACRAGQGIACSNAGYLFKTGTGTKKDLKRAFAFFRQSCQRNHGRGCNEMGLFIERGLVGPKNRTLARNLFVRACKLRYPIGCQNAGSLFQFAPSKQRDSKKAMSYFQFGCRAGLGSSCLHLGLFYYRGKDSQKNYRKALQYFLAACKRRAMNGCTNAGILMEKGFGGKANLQQAIKVYTIACKHKHGPGCQQLGLLYQRGHGLKQDLKKAFTYLSKACQLKFGNACAHLGQYFEKGMNVTSQPKKAFQYYKQACQAKSPLGCTHLGRAYQNGIGHKVNLPIAMRYYQIACGANHPRGCLLLGLLSMKLKASKVKSKKTKAIFKRAFALANSSCKEKNGDACQIAGRLQERGLGTKASILKALQNYGQACQMHSAEGCARLGKILSKGLMGKKPNCAQVNLFYKRACALQYKAACAWRCGKKSLKRPPVAKVLLPLGRRLLHPGTAAFNNTIQLLIQLQDKGSSLLPLVQKLLVRSFQQRMHPNVSIGFIRVIGSMGLKAKRAQPLLLRVIRHRHPAIRFHTIHTLGKIGVPNKKTLLLLSKQLTDKRPPLRAVSLQALAQLVKRSHQVKKQKAIAPALIQRLLGYCGNKGTKLAPLEVIAHFGKMAPKVLLRGLGNKNLKSKWCAIDAIGKLKKKSKPAQNALLPLLKASSSLTQLKSAVALSRIAPDHPQVVMKLLHFLKSSKPEQQSTAIKALAKSKIYRAKLVPVLLGLSKHKSPKVQVAVLAFFAQFSLKSTIEFLTQKRAYASPKLALGVLTILEKHISTQAATKLDDKRLSQLISFLLDVSRQRDVRVHKQSAKVLTRLGVRALPELLLALAHKSPSTREVASNALGKMGKKVHPALLITLGHRIPHVRASALKAIGHTHTPNTAKTIAPFLSDTDPTVGAFAALALSQFGASAKSTVPNLQKALMAILTKISRSPRQKTKVKKALHQKRLFKQAMLFHALGKIEGIHKSKASLLIFADLITLPGIPSQLRLEAMKALYAAALAGPIPLNRAFPAFVRILKDKTAPTALRELAALSLSLQPKHLRFVLPTLRSMLKGPLEKPLKNQKSSQALVALYIHEIAPVGAELLPDLLHYVERAGQRTSIHIWRAFQRMGPKCAVLIPKLVQLTESKKTFMRFVAIHLIGSVGPKALFLSPLLLKKLKDPQAKVRQAAQQVLVKFKKWKASKK